MKEQTLASPVDGTMLNYLELYESLVGAQYDAADAGEVKMRTAAHGSGAPSGTLCNRTDVLGGTIIFRVRSTN